MKGILAYASRDFKLLSKGYGPEHIAKDRSNNG